MDTLHKRLGISDLLSYKGRENIIDPLRRPMVRRYKNVLNSNKYYHAVRGVIFITDDTVALTSQKYCFITYSSVWEQSLLHLLLYYHTNLVLSEVKNTVMHYSKVIWINLGIYISTLTEKCTWDCLRLSVLSSGCWPSGLQLPAFWDISWARAVTHDWLSGILSSTGLTTHPHLRQITTFLQSLKGSRLWFITRCGLEDLSHLDVH